MNRMSQGQATKASCSDGTSAYLGSPTAALPAKLDSPQGARLAVWQAKLSGTQWLDEHAMAGEAVVLSANGYPSLYTAQADKVLAALAGGPPYANNPWNSGAGDIITDKWAGRTTIDAAVRRSCKSEEWLIVEVWDES